MEKHLHFADALDHMMVFGGGGVFCHARPFESLRLSLITPCYVKVLTIAHRLAIVMACDRTTARVDRMTNTTKTLSQTTTFQTQQ